MKIKTKTVNEVGYGDLNKEIIKFLKSKGCLDSKYRYNCVAEEEWSNDSSHEFTVDGKLDDFFEKYHKPDILSGKFGYKTGAILNWMAAEKVIEPGEYLVSVCW